MNMHVGNLNWYILCTRLTEIRIGVLGFFTRARKIWVSTQNMMCRLAARMRR